MYGLYLQTFGKSRAKVEKLSKGFFMGEFFKKTQEPDNDDFAGKGAPAEGVHKPAILYDLRTLGTGVRGCRAQTRRS
jgi:hypothetical protein